MKQITIKNKKYRIREGSIADFVITNKVAIGVVAILLTVFGSFYLATLAFGSEKPAEVPQVEKSLPDAVSGATDGNVCEGLNSLGEFEITYYCREVHPHICNDGNAIVTASGTVPTVGRTIAVDPEVIPYGTEVMINGNSYIAEDTGSAIEGNRIDILVETHNEALQKGIMWAEVYVKGGAM